jgi:hypothetical protein
MLAAMLGGPRLAADAHKICLHGLRSLNTKKITALKSDESQEKIGRPITLSRTEMQERD